MTDFMWGSLFRRQRFFGTTRNFPTFHFRKSISWTGVRLRAACRCFASRSRAKLPSRSEAQFRASSRSIYKFGERTNAHCQPSAAKEYLETWLLCFGRSPLFAPFFFLHTSLLLCFSSSSFGAHSPLAAIYIRGIPEGHGAWRRGAK